MATQLANLYKRRIRFLKWGQRLAPLSLALALLASACRPASLEAELPTAGGERSGGSDAAPVEALDELQAAKTATNGDDSLAGDPADAADDFFILHTVGEGDTLGTIAGQYATSIDLLVSLNQITDSNIIFVGQVLRVPGPRYQALVSPKEIIIPDSELVHGPSARTFDTADFVGQLGGYLRGYTEEVEGQSLTGAEIVELVAGRHSVNPRLLLAALEYQAQWLSEPEPLERRFPLGYREETSEGLYKQLRWAANVLNWGFYGRSEGGMTSFLVAGEIPLEFAPEINDGTAGVQNYLAARDGISYDAWLRDVGSAGFRTTYSTLFGDPSASAVEPLLPADLQQPALELPWSKGETWYFTGGPHGGWNTGSAWAALDFVPSDVQGGCGASEAWVTAVAGGMVTRSGFGAVVVDLDGDAYAGTGWALTYMHLDDQDRVAEGTAVKTGDRLGHPGCEGGFANGTHLHLARTYNGRWISADGQVPFVLGGWVSGGSGSEYNGWLEKDGIVKTADVWHTAENAILAD